MFEARNLLRWGWLTAFVWACQLGNNNGTELPNELTGQLYLKGGAPAVNAQVSLYPMNYSPGNAGASAGFKTARTDNTGRFQFSNMTSGRYNILSKAAATEGSSDSLFALSDSVLITGAAQELPPDTLTSPGSFTGRVQMQPGDDPRTVLLMALGTQLVATADSTGNFNLTNMAQGDYTVRILTTLDKYLPLDFSIHISSGVHDTLASSIALPFKGIPIVTGLKVKYDTLLQIATLSWKRADTALVSGYNIYRKRSDSNYVKLNSITLNDTQYVDSLMMQDYSYQFNIKTVDKNGNEGAFQNGVKIQAVGTYVLMDSLDLGGLVQDMHYNGQNLLVVSDYGLIGKARLTVLDTSLTILGTFYADSVTSLKGIDASNRIWTNVNTRDSSGSTIGAVRIFSVAGDRLGTLFDVPGIAGPSPSALAVKNHKAYVSSIFGVGLIRVYDDSFRFLSNFPENSAALQFGTFDARFFDNGSNNKLTLLSRGQIFIYDTLGTLLGQQTLPYSDVKAVNLLSNQGYIVYHCDAQRRCYCDILDSNFKQTMIFLGRLHTSLPAPIPTFSAFIDAHDKLYIMEAGKPVKVYRRR